MRLLRVPPPPAPGRRRWLGTGLWLLALLNWLGRAELWPHTGWLWPWLLLPGLALPLALLPAWLWWGWRWLQQVAGPWWLRLPLTAAWLGGTVLAALLWCGLLVFAARAAGRVW